VRILVVEDEALVAMMVQDMIADLGHNLAGPVGRLGAAIECARSVVADAALLDVNLHGEKSFAVAEVLKHRAENTNRGFTEGANADST
jgi:DNA-binding response OmpR family regulator